VARGWVEEDSEEDGEEDGEEEERLMVKSAIG
jgi:hypothetical protein